MSKVLVTGAAGFMGANLVDYYLKKGDFVVGVDNLATGRMKNIQSALGNANFKFIKHDITHPLPEELSTFNFQLIANLACPASPPKYQELALETMRVSSIGLENMLNLALNNRCRILHTSTSEVYGDPQVHPQPESYWGNANSYGSRSMYDEGKRYGEALIWVYQKHKKVNVGIVRIFNTYGPNMDPQDGRVVSNFIIQSLKNEPITIYGSGSQTRSFCFVDDEIEGIARLANCDIQEPINIGNPNEFSVLELANMVINLTKSKSQIKLLPSAPDDPKQRQPDITKAKQLLGWEPKVNLEEGLKRTIEYFKGEI